jgi:TIR domain
LASVYISYRREDAYSVGRLYDRLVYALGPENVFLDVDSIEPGADFVDVIESTIAKATVVLVVIGPQWLTAPDLDGKPRLLAPDDFIHREIGTALARSVRVVPVLVDGASLPRSDDLPSDIAALSRRNALEISYQTFAGDVARLVDTIQRIDEQDAGRGGSTVPRARLTAVGEELRAVAVEFFSTAGRPVVDTLDRRLLGPDPILIVDSSSFSEQDVADIGGAARGRRRLYLVHPDRLDDASAHQLDRLRAHGNVIVPLSGNTMAAAITDTRTRAVLLELEREYGSDRNLFETRNSVIDERFLFGRSELLTRLGGAIAAAESMLLTGLRKAGKTSVLNILRQHLVDYPVCHVDLQRFDRSDERWPRQLFAVMLDAYDRWGRAQVPGWDFAASSDCDPFTEMDRRREHQDNQGQSTPFVLLLDEMERVLPLPGEVEAAAHFARATGLIRALTQTHPGWFVVIGADLRPTANRMNLLPNGETNPLFQFFEETPIRLLGEEAVDEMIRSLCHAMGVWNVDRRLGRAVFRLSGGHPALVRMLAGASYRCRKGGQHLRSADLPRGLDDLAESNLLGSFFAENFWGPMTEPERQIITGACSTRPRGILSRRASAGDEVDAEARAALVGQGLLRDGRVAVGAFADWVRARS